MAVLNIALGIVLALIIWNLLQILLAILLRVENSSIVFGIFAIIIGVLGGIGIFYLMFQ